MKPLSGRWVNVFLWSAAAPDVNNMQVLGTSEHWALGKNELFNLPPGFRTQ